ncbi:hypothetical protein NUSPORA_00995 [Nucleospora cyclopteri]
MFKNNFNKYKKTVSVLILLAILNNSKKFTEGFKKYIILINGLIKSDKYYFIIYTCKIL